MCLVSEEDLKFIVQRWTDKKVQDKRADRDALEDIVALVCTDKDITAAANKINSWRREKIETT